MKKLVKIGGQFSGVGAFDQALNRLKISYINVYQAEWDKFSRTTYLHNYEEPIYYVKDVYDTPTKEITEKYGSLDIAMFSPPCQAFSLAGKRLGKEDKRGILFFNSHEFIQVNKPRYFIFENVKGLLSDDNGKTFSEWINMLGGKSVNGNTVMFPHDDAVPYHIYWQVLNAKDYGVPQNRERVFIIGIRDDADNNFSFPKEEFLYKRLKDILEENVDEKYFLSEKMLNYLQSAQTDGQYLKTNVLGNLSGGKWDKIHESARRVYNIETYSPAINTMQGGNLEPKILQLNKPIHSQQRVYSTDGISPTISAGSNGGGQNPTKHLTNDYKFRRLTPRECFRLMDFPDTFDFSCVSDSQAYKQAGNSIVVGVLARIINKLNLK